MTAVSTSDSIHVATAPSLRVLLMLAWPIVVARATQAVVGFTDALMTAPLGEDVLAAVTTGSLDVLTFVMMPMGTVFILQSFAAQLRGRGDLEAVRRYALYGLIFAFGAGLLAALFIPFVAPVIGLLDYTPSVQAHMVEYLRARLWSVGAIVGIEALNNWYGGLGNTRVALIVGVLTMVLNVLLNYALIEPRFGLPGYGAAGSAWASTIATWIGFFTVLAMYLRGMGHDLPKARLHLRRAEMWRVLRFGLPSGVNWFLEFAAFALFINVVVGHLGTTVLAAFNVVFQINSISFMPAFGVASAGAILVGEAIGKRTLEVVWPIVRTTLIVTLSWMGAVGVIYMLAPGPLMSVFQSDEVPAAELVKVGATMLALCGIWQVFDAITLTLSEVLRAAGDTTWPMTARIVMAWLMFTPMAWAAVFWFDGGVVTVMVSVIVYIAALALVLAHRYQSGRWKTIELVETVPATLITDAAG